MTNKVHLRLAQTKEEFEAAYRLMGNSTYKSNEKIEGLWLLKQHALPSTSTIIACKGQEVVGAISLFGENPFLLPIEERVNLTQFKEDIHGRIAEISMPGIKGGKEEENILFALFQYITQFGSNYCRFDTFVFSAPSDWSQKYAFKLGFRNLKNAENHLVFQLNPNDSINYSTFYTGAFQAEFQYPEKKFFLVAHQSMSPEVLHYLFNEKTNLFDTLSDLEFRVLKNIYDYGEYSKSLPKRISSDSRLPQHRRFPMNCQGDLKRASGEKMNLMVIDVSRQGLKLKTEDLMRQGEVCALTVSIGVMKRTELIAKVVWVDDYNQIAGLEVKSGDKNWIKLIEYLEKDFLLCAS